MYNKIKKHGSVLFLILIVAANSYAVPLKTAISANKLTVGDILYLKICAEIPKNTTLTPPEPEKFTKDIVVKEWNSSRTEGETADSIFFDYSLTTYIPQNCTIPQLPFIFSNSDQAADTFFTEVIPLEIISVITEVDSNLDIKDLKPQQIAGKAPMWWLWGLCLLALAALIIILIKLLFRKKQRNIVVPPPKPPYEEAMAAILELEYKNYITRGLIREYCFELSEIFKRYIARRFEVNAEEFTTEEMIAWLGISGLELKYRNASEWFFRTTDLVKFARFTPDSSVIDRFMKEVSSFLEATKPIETAKKDQDDTDIGQGEKQAGSEPVKQVQSDEKQTADGEKK